MPPAFVAPLAQVAVDAVVKDATLLEGFTADGFVSTLFDRLATTTHCAVSSRPLDASPPLSLAYEVVFGDAQEGWADACAWVARRGTDMVVMMAIPPQPVAVANGTAICPQRWVDSETRVVVGYFAGLLPVPSPSPSPGPSVGGAGLSVGAIVGIAVASAALLVFVAIVAVWRAKARSMGPSSWAVLPYAAPNDDGKPTPESLSTGVGVNNKTSTIDPGDPSAVHDGLGLRVAP